MSEKKSNYTARRFHDPLDDFLDRPIAFNPVFKKITGSTVAALMLSQAWYWSKRTSDDDGWFFKIGSEWEEETGLSRSEQETARKILKTLGIMEEDLRGVPARLYYRIERGKIYEIMGLQFAEIPQTSMGDSAIQGRDILANINRNTENTAENNHLLVGIEASIYSNRPTTQEDVDFSNGKKEAGLDWQGRELIRADLLPLADWYNQATNQVMTKRVQKSWWKALGEWKEEGLTPEHLQVAFDAQSKWRLVSDPNMLTKDAVAVKAAGVKSLEPEIEKTRLL